MLANEPCAEDLIPKNRQNNVYGHGHVNAQPAVEEAANYFYELSMSLNVTLSTEYGANNRVHIDQGEAVEFNLAGGAQRVQWRTWDMRDNWMDLADFNPGDETFEVTHGLLVDRLKFLPNNTVEGHQVILVRAIADDKASTNLAVGVHIMGGEKIETLESDGSLLGLLVGLLALLVLVLFGALIFIGLLIRKERTSETYYEYDDTYPEHVEDPDLEGGSYADKSE